MRYSGSIVRSDRRRHDRSLFDCGEPALNDWLKLRASQFDAKDLAKTFVAVRDNSTLVDGYYAISSHTVRYDALPADLAKGMPKIDQPALLIGRLAVVRRLQGQKLGQVLLLDALSRAEDLATSIGIRVVEVQALHDQAKEFYLHFGFLELLDDPRHLLMPMDLIRGLKLPPPEA